LEGFHVARARFRKAMQRGKNVHGGGLLRLRTSALAGSVQTIRFTWVPESGRSLPG
jgi:hypothetical protein